MLVLMPKRNVYDSNGAFLAAVSAEQAGDMEDARALYEELTEHDPFYGPAFVNLGTLYFHAQRFTKALEMYKQATKIDPDYALGFFNLGNALDEFGREEESADAYKRAIALGHTDAHYNLALLYQEHGRRRDALRHWQAYAKLDRTGPWAEYARMQIRSILENESLQLVKGKQA